MGKPKKGGIAVADYHALYLKLAGVQADAIDTLKNMQERLIQAHQDAEEEILNAPEPQIIPFVLDDEQ